MGAIEALQFGNAHLAVAARLVGEGEDQVTFCCWMFSGTEGAQTSILLNALMRPKSMTLSRTPRVCLQDVPVSSSGLFLFSPFRQV